MPAMTTKDPGTWTTQDFMECKRQGCETWKTTEWEMFFFCYGFSMGLVLCRAVFTQPNRKLGEQTNPKDCEDSIGFA